MLVVAAADDYMYYHNARLLLCRLHSYHSSRSICIRTYGIWLMWSQRRELTPAVFITSCCHSRS